MMRSMTLQSKISRTKKRLSETTWYVPTVVIIFLGLVVVYAYGLRLTALSGVHGTVPAEIPVMRQSLQDPALHTFTEESDKELSPDTPVIVLTHEAFYFGDLKAFTTDFASPDNKYALRHRDHQPDLGELLHHVEGWARGTNRYPRFVDDGIVVLMSAGSIRASIVTQVVAGLRVSPMFSRVILAGGLL